MQKMSSISAQGVVERASAELSKRINGLGLRSKHHHNSNSNAASGGGTSGGSSGGSSSSGSGSGKTSVMERVTNALCGGSSHNNAGSIGGAPEKPSRVGATGQAAAAATAASQANGCNPAAGSASGAPSATTAAASANNKQIAGLGGTGKNGTTNSQQSTPLVSRKQHQQQALMPVHHHHQHPHAAAAVHHLAVPPTASAIATIGELLLDDKFLARFFQYFTPFERRHLAQVCQRWRDIMYRSPRYWSGLLPVLQCRELRLIGNQDRVKLYNSLIRRGFHAVCLVSATDEDALDVVHSFPLASKHVHSLSLRCSSISDRGLEALLDHLQVGWPGVFRGDYINLK